MLRFRDIKKGMLIGWKDLPFYALIVSEKMFHKGQKRKDDYYYYETLVINRNTNDTKKSVLAKFNMRSSIYEVKKDSLKTKITKQMFVEAI